MFVAIVDSEGIGHQSVPNVARMVKEGMVRMARDRARKSNQAKGKLMMARRKAKAKVTNGKHARHLKGSAITVRNGHGKGLFQKSQNQGKRKSTGSLDEFEASAPENSSVCGFGLCSFGNSQYDEWKWNDCRKVTFTLDSGAVYVARKSLGDDYPMQIEEPRLYKTRLENPYKMKDFECYRL